MLKADAEEAAPIAQNVLGASGSPASRRRQNSS